MVVPHRARHHVALAEDREGRVPRQVRDAGAGGAGIGDAALRHRGIDTGRPAAVAEPGP
ncbi:hypothetical protein PV341_11865 [Streptomyces sp. PA03-1a]|nr:hypothetical protein [Streptomyces sp. PA03-1a]